MKITKGFEVFLWMPLLLFNLGPSAVVSQGHFPRMENIAAFKPVSTAPARSTCGFPGRTSYCRAASSVASLASCSQAFCVQECPYRSSTAPYAPLLLPAHRGTCVTEDFNDTQRMEPEGQAIAKAEAAPFGHSSVVFQTTQGGCLVSPPSQDLGPLGSLTLAVWIKPSNPGEMVLLEKSSGGHLVFVLTVSDRAAVLRYGLSSGPALLSASFRTEGRLSLHRWTHLVLQVHDRQASLFLDGLEEDGTPFDTRPLTSMLNDVREDSTMWVGLSSNGTNQFIGRMQDFRFYPTALTNREIVELYSGVLPHLHTQPECRCPPSHPRVHPLIERYCIPNAVEDTTANRVLRLNLNAHPLSYVNDQDMGTSWLSRTMTTQEDVEDGLTITVDLANGQYQVFYVIVQFGGLLPERVVIQRRSADAPEPQNHGDAGESPWSDWQYMARDCGVFGMQNNGPLPTPGSVNCLQLPGDAPLSGGNVTFALLTPEPNPRPGYNDFYNTPELRRMVQATQVRVLLSGQYHSEAAGVNRGHRYFAINEITISGRCECHGHAEQCDTAATPYRCACLPESHTEGNNCERCVPLYNDKPFSSGGQFQPMSCRPCQCNGHARSCHYDVSADGQPGEHYRGGGGVCDDCTHNTTGKNCELCRNNFFRLEGADPGAADVCQPCNCNTAGTLNGSTECDQVGGECRCKAAVTGRQCADCLPGWFSLQGWRPQGCVRCNCSEAGISRGPHVGLATCDQLTGQCHCKPHVTGLSCDRCEFGFWNLSRPDGCVPCDCDPLGSLSPYCEPQGGQCECRPGVGGLRCGSCGWGSYGLGPDGSCAPCNCSAEGTVGGPTACDPHTGQCLCKDNVEGLRCDACRRGYHSLDRRNSLGCLPCACDAAGAAPGAVCDAATGQCPCRGGVEGSRCTRCARNYYNGSDTEAEGGPLGCVPCTCDPRGTVEGTVCHSTTGQCVCLHTHHQRDCGSCRPGFYLEGGQCAECDCHPTGALESRCEGQSGRCLCAHPSVGGQHCDQCREMYHGFNPGLGSCQPCVCDAVGSVNGSCHPDTGACVCRALVTGARCNLCLPGASHMNPDNHLGCSKAPSQQPPPSGLVLSVSSIRLTWPPPDSPNSHKVNYTLLRDARPVYSLQSHHPYSPVSFEDTGLSPYTSYSYWLRTSSVAGQTESVAVSYQTLAAVPDAKQLQLKLLGSPGHASASFNWTSPPSHAGPVERFVLSSIESASGNRTVHHSGLSTQAIAVGLKPYTFYTFTLEACSAGGCSSGRPLSLRTDPAPPRDQPPPRVNVTGPHTMHLTWEPPGQPNGVITQYEVFLRGPMEAQNLSSPANETRVFVSSGWLESDRSRGSNRKMVQPPESSALITGLQPFSTYQTRVASVNTAGHVTSEWATARTTEGAPEFVSPPNVSATSSSSLRVSWNSTEGHGVIAMGTVTEYRVNMVTEQSNNPHAPPVFSQVLHRTNASAETAHVVEGLRPHQVYNFTITVCTSAGCTTSLPASGQTLPGAPSGLSLPRLLPVNETTLHVEWSPPVLLNGPAPVYQVERTDVSLSDPSEPVTRGTRFPGSGYYRFPGRTIPVNTDYTGIQLSFRSRSPDGLLLCAFSPGGQEEFLALQLQHGRPYFLFDPQDSAVAVGVQDDGHRRYDDGEWHSVTATRHGAVGTIIVDHQYQGRAGGSSLSSIIGENTGLYVGGLPTNFTILRQHLGDTQLVRKGFSGCLRDVKLKHTASPSGQWKPLDWSTAVEKVAAYESWEGCPVDSEEGAHFLGHGYLELDRDVFSGGKHFDITMEFRTDQLNAILIFTYSNESDDFMLVELESGLLYFVLSWGGHVTELIMWVGLSYCDGGWNQLSLAKHGAVISAAVNDWEEQLTGAVGEGGLSVDSSLYLGGVPTDLMHPALAGSRHRNGLGGCLRSLTVQSDGAQQQPVSHTVNLSTASRHSVRVHLDGCSPGDSRFLCRGNDSVLVYSGRDTHTTDYGLQPFTEYLYRCVAIAEGGWSAGPWQRGRSRGTVAEHVLPPSMVQSKGGFSAQVKWAPPTDDVRGLIDRYELRAYQRDHPAADPVVESIHPTDGNYTGLLSGLTPATRYVVTVSVCSPRGCTESQRYGQAGRGDDEGQSWSFTTPEEAPEAVHPPAGVASPFTLNITWQPPARPNGRITSYRLYHNGRRIYMGNDTQFSITALAVYSTHVLVLSACTSAGCSNSSQVTMVTSQLPPGPLLPPGLTLLDAQTILVEWSRPAQVNGALRSYSVFLSREEAEPQLVYNSTRLQEDHTLHNLVPGTAYAIRVAACTGGGCTLSPASHARTEESTPENVPAPLVTPLSPHALNVTWTPPATPNGIITSYGVWLDGELLLNSSSSQSSFVVEGLSPWSLHTLRLQACTVQACGRGPTVEVRTQEKPPVGAVLLDMTNQSSRSLRARWTRPARPNGNLSYTLHYQSTDGEGLLSGGSDAGSWLTVNDLRPHSSYTFWVTACNTQGCVESPPRSLTTLPAAPDGVSAPGMADSSPTSLNVSWFPAEHANAPGPLVYGLRMKSAPHAQEVSLLENATDVFSYVVGDLSPFTPYYFRLLASHTYGHVSSPWASLRTAQDRPGPVASPLLSALHSRNLTVSWLPPSQPNGLITKYTVYLLSDPHSNPNSTSTPATATAQGPDLYPGPSAQPTLTSGDQYSRRSRPAHLLSTPAPLEASPPEHSTAEPGPASSALPGAAGATATPGTDGGLAANALNPAVLVVNRRPVGGGGGGGGPEAGPEDPPGPLIRSPMSATVPGNTTSFTFTQLRPYHTYTMRVEACTSAGCSSSYKSQPFRTPPAPPEGVPAPYLYSVTPTSVLLSWGELGRPNGPLEGWLIERRVTGTTQPSTVGQLPASSVPLSYLDSSSALSPWTSYQYRLVAHSAAGRSNGPWAIVTTKPSRPAGLSPPRVAVLGPESLQVTWSPPLIANGELQDYEVRMPHPRLPHPPGNGSHLNVTVTGLVPFTLYNVTVLACSAGGGHIGGCTESLPTPVMTLPTNPQGLAPMSVVAVSESFLAVSWQAPGRPNGPNIRYELLRRKTRQPLAVPTATAAPAGDLHQWARVYSGTKLFYQDKGLSRFTTYQYRLLIHNDVNYTSGEIVSAATMGGVPRSAPPVTAVPVNHTAIRVNWTKPSVHDLQGEVVLYFLTVQGANISERLTCHPGVLSTVVGDLWPSTSYRVSLHVSNGAHNTTRSETRVSTKDGEPEGLSAPEVVTVNSSAVRVLWSPPRRPNGAVTAYRVYLDDQRQGNTGARSGSFLLGGLLPFTVYNIQVEVCTVYACVKSNVTQATTVEDIPSELAAPRTHVLNSRAVRLEWSGPGRPSGIMLGYELLRRAYRPCDERGVTASMVGKSGARGEKVSCSYLQCPFLHAVCGGSCFQPDKQVCCDGVSYIRKIHHQCCGREYLFSPNSSLSVCCGDKLHPHLPGHQCCGGYYVAMNTSDHCCPDPSQGRVSVGEGDGCCGGTPFSQQGPQLCCAGALHDAHGAQCCGAHVVDSGLVCCGSADRGRAYTPAAGFICCGQEYVNSSTSLCCVGRHGHPSMHPAGNGTVTLRCCGSKVIRQEEECCNGIGYDPRRHVCADQPTSGLFMQPQCAQATLCPVAAASTAYCGACDVDPALTACTWALTAHAPPNDTRARAAGAATATAASPPPPAVVVPAAGAAAAAAEGSRRAEEGGGDTPAWSWFSRGLCPSLEEVAYSGEAHVYTYTDSSLEPFTTYEYRLQGWNSFGKGSSDATAVTTSEERPWGVSPPRWSRLGARDDVLQLYWQPPARPNGDISHYVIMRDGQERYRGTDNSFTDVGGIKPFVEYSYQLGACNRAGCSDSERVVAVTVQGVPEDVAPPAVTALTPKSLLVTWPPPEQANGAIQRYLLNQTGVGLLYTSAEGARNYTVTGLQPFTEYSFVLTACTAVGCGTSQPSTGRTLQASPSGVWFRPRHLSVDASVVELYWSQPLRPNGQLTRYRLLRDGRTVFTGDHHASNFTDAGLLPNHRYVYQLEASTGGGTSVSDRYVVQTPESCPTGIPPPHNVTVAGARSLFVAWRSPAWFDSSQLLLYDILFNPGTETALTRPAGQALHLSVTGLEPFTSYYVRVQACQRVGCGVGQGVFTRTLEATPETLLPPRITAAGAQELEVRWSPPLHPNGLITSYFIHRRPEGTEEELLVFIWSEGPLEFIDASQALQPFSQYQYRVQAHNSKGSVESQWASARTLEAAPKGMTPPTVVPTGAYSARLKWSEPHQPNGRVSNYRVFYKKHEMDPTVNASSVTALTVEGSVQEVTVYGLLPYTEYSLRVEATNSAGSVSSEWAGTRTLESSPAGLGVLQAEHREQGRALLLSWDPPHTPNGVVMTYNMYSQGDLEFSGLSRHFLFRRLEPWTTYTLVLEACTSRGCVRGLPQQITTSAAPPTAQHPPRPLSIGPDQVSLAWDPPSEPNGPIKEYTLMWRSVEDEARGRSHEVIKEKVLFTEDHPGDPNSFSYTVAGLRPWTQYQFSVRSHNHAGNTLSPWVTVTTKQAPPSSLAPPSVTHIHEQPSELLISWAPPLESNGVLLSYRIQRDKVSFPFSFDPAVTSYHDEDLAPFATYSYAVIACTSGGCVTSPPTYTTTLEAPPAAVGPPTVRRVTAQSADVSWATPPLHNGRVTEYALQLNGRAVYRGQGLSSVVSDLQPHTSYRLALLACTSGGCTPSAAVTLVTGEAPPAGLRRPTVKTTGPESVEVSWNPPEEPNGVITGYELRRDGEVVYVGQETHYHDFMLLPNVGYNYVVAANNSQGAVSSPPAAAKTHPSAPSGVGPPTLQPLGPSQVMVEWSPPARSNGDLVSYTVYQRDPAQLLTNSTTFTPRDSAFSVRNAHLLGLAPYHRYEVRVEACTALGCSSSDWSSILTPESPPAGQPSPLLDLQPNAVTGLHTTFLLTWPPPAHPNGVVLHYEVYRKVEHTGDVRGRTGSALVCRNISTTCKDDGLEPYTVYQYQVWAVNSAGHSASPWANGRTGPAPPEGIAPPTFQRIQATWAVVDILPPARPNGIVSLYRVFSQDNNTYILLSEGTSRQQTLHGLSPYTLYWVGVEACTCYQCCSRGPLSQLRTPSAPPDHQPQPRPRSLSSRSVQLEWDGPLAPNGVIERCELHSRLSCPQPPQPVPLPCVEGPIEMCYFGTGRSYNLTGLQPYFSYKLRVACFNNMGSTASNWTAVTTRSEAPQYLAPFSVGSNVTLVWLDWGNSFSLNGPLSDYTVTEGRMRIYNGFQSYLHVPRTSQKTLLFQVICATHFGSASTPFFRYSPVTGLTPVEPTEGGKQWVGMSASPVYSELWFILLLSLLGLFLLFVLLGLVLSRALMKSPASRDRPPLVPQQKTRNGGEEAYMRPCPVLCSKHHPSSVLLAGGRPLRHPYATFETVTDNVEVTNVTLKSYTVFTEGLADTKIIGGDPHFSPMAVLRTPSQSELGRAFSQHSLHRSVSQLIDRKSLMEEEGWDNPMAQDSGLYAEEDEFADTIKSFGSMRKDHTMFIDTHL